VLIVRWRAGCLRQWFGCASLFPDGWYGMGSRVACHYRGRNGGDAHCESDEDYVGKTKDPKFKDRFPPSLSVVPFESQQEIDDNPKKDDTPR